MLTIVASCVELMVVSFFIEEGGNWLHHLCVAAVSGQRLHGCLVARRLELLLVMEVLWWSSRTCQSSPLFSDWWFCDFCWMALFTARSPGCTDRKEGREEGKRGLGGKFGEDRRRMKKIRGLGLLNKVGKQRS